MVVLLEIDNIVVSRDLRETNTNVRVTGEAVRGLQLDYHQKVIRDWLSAPDPSTNYANALERRHEGTGLWFIQGEDLERWKRQPNSFLWLHGIPGCGKTVLSSTVIGHLRDNIEPDRALLYFYFDFDDPRKQTLENMLRSLTSQLYQEKPEARSPLDHLWTSHRNVSQDLSRESLSAVLLGMLRKVKDTSIVLDALDESSTKSALLSWLQSIHEIDCPVRVLITSRTEEVIESALQSWIRPENRISIQVHNIDRDIRAYISHTVRNGKELQRWRNRPDVQDEIESELVGKAEGM